MLASLLEPEERAEGHLKVRGVARYAADASRPGMLWSATVYSPVAHARITKLDASAARAMPGVHAVLTGDRPRLDACGAAECATGRCWPSIGCASSAIVWQSSPRSRSDIAQAAAQAIDVEYEELPAVFDPLAAVAARRATAARRRRLVRAVRPWVARRAQPPQRPGHAGHPQRRCATSSRSSPRRRTSSSTRSRRRASIRASSSRRPVCCGSTSRTWCT